MELHSGFVRLTEWSNDKASERLGHPVSSFTVERRYKTSKGDWRSSPSLFLRDLADLEALCRAAYDKLSVKERHFSQPEPANPPATPENSQKEVDQ
jgi:hypothetical protein